MLILSVIRIVYKLLILTTILKMQKRFFKNDFDIKENISNFASVKANKANIISTIVDDAVLLPFLLPIRQT